MRQHPGDCACAAHASSPERRARTLRRIAVAIAVVLVFVAIALPVFARPGGGDSYGGGGDSGGGGGSDSGGGGGAGAIAYLFIYLVQLAFEVPIIGVPLLILFVVGVIFGVRANAKRKKGAWTTGYGEDGGARVAQARAIQRQQRGPAPARRFEDLRRYDADFSQVLFEDFLYALYAETQRARGTGQLEALSPYLSAAARESLRVSVAGLAEVKGIVIGAMHVKNVSIDQTNAAVRVLVEFEVNYVEVVRDASGKAHEQTYYVDELWSLYRKLSAKSRTPDRARNITCPKCGAPLSSTSIRGGTCAYCNSAVDTGEFDWLVASVTIQRKEQRPPQLTTDMQEIGTDWPTVLDPDAKDRFRQLCERDPSFDWGKFQARLELIFKELQVGWTSRDWMRVRPFITDNLFQQQMFWIEAYKAAGLRNQLDGARVLRVEAAKVVSDRWYDAFTVRVYATGLDYVVKESGGIVRGSDTEERQYTEYWTMIRGSAVRGTSRVDPVCPNCGGTLKITMFGNCEFCKAKVTSGDFDWVLSRIEQDESYDG